jgi:hypothetical protein
MKTRYHQYEPSASKHTLAIARWEDNSDRWLKGDFLQLDSKIPMLQQKVGSGGTLWIVVSSPHSDENMNRLYSLSFRLNNCRFSKHSVGTDKEIFSVIGDPNKSVMFSPNDASLILMSLRFDPYKPIKNVGMIGNSIQTPRSLSEHDIKILERYSNIPDRWSVFISYQNTNKEDSNKLSNALRLAGVNVFRDKESLVGGEDWWKRIQQVIQNSRYFVLLMSENSRKSEYVIKELKLAIENKITLIPVHIHGSIDDWKEYPEIGRSHILFTNDWNLFINQLLKAIGSPLTNLEEINKP